MAMIEFFLCCIILGLGYIHDSGLAHRDIKPENLVFDDKGYIRITDFGIAKRTDRDLRKEKSGTPGYMAPEVIYSENHTHVVDYFALGVIGYECMLGSRPYLGRNCREMKSNMLAQQILIKANEVPIGWSFEAADLINQLIQRKASSRLGYNGIDDIKNHNWLKDINWDDLAEKRIISPFIPQLEDNFDDRYCNGEDKPGLDTQNRYKLYQGNERYKLIFVNYTFNNLSPEELKQLLSPMGSNSTRSSPGQPAFQIRLKDSPTIILRTPKALALKKIKQNTICISNSNQNHSKYDEKNNSEKGTLPLIGSTSSLHKSSSSMLVYNNQLSKSLQTKRKSNIIRRSFLKSTSPIMLIKRMSNLPKDLSFIRHNDSVILREKEKMKQ